VSRVAFGWRAHFRPLAPILLGLTLAAAAGCRPQPAETGDLLTEVSALLTQSAVAWNAGDLDAFVSDYARDSLTTFVSAGRPQYGFDWIRSNYAPAFAAGAQRDSLRFENITARSLGRAHALATARFVLFRGDSVTASGPFTLVLTRTDGRWLIIHDHTSSDPL
jgi:uncharacterized protein (TIGR02246 family)